MKRDMKSIFSSKGMELPVNVIVIIIFSMVILIAVILFINSNLNPLKDSVKTEQRRTELCKTYSEYGCKISDIPVFILNFESDLKAVCKKTGIIGDDCMPFDEKCGKVCCRMVCG
jgi:hypothetical protein